MTKKLMTVKEVELLTGLQVIQIEEWGKWVRCTLSNGWTFSFRKW